MVEKERLAQGLIAEAVIWEARQFIAELADCYPVSFIKGCELQTMLGAILVTHHSLHTQLRVSRHCEPQPYHAALWDWLRKKSTESAFRDLVAVSLEVALVESDRNR